MDVIPDTGHGMVLRIRLGPGPKPGILTWHRTRTGTGCKPDPDTVPDMHWYLVRVPCAPRTSTGAVHGTEVGDP